MTRNGKIARLPREARRNGSWKALQRLDAALERNNEDSNALKIEILERIMFEDWRDDDEKPGSAQKNPTNNV